MKKTNLFHTITVNLSDWSYPIFIGCGLLQDRARLLSLVPATQVMIVSNPTVALHYLKTLQEIFSARQCDVVLLPDGEQYKSLDTLTRIFQGLYEKTHHRDTTLIALGGGVISDMTGFAAACYQRGVNFLAIPTTLLAQVDAAVGGKTGVNFADGKNLIGAFHQPGAVIIDVATLSTLPPRELRAGLAEIIKSALIKSVDFFQWLEQNCDQILALETAILCEAIYQSDLIKATIVEADEKENAARALLNFGHTFAHAIETATDFQRFLHGEAVAIGMCLAAQLAVELGYLTENLRQRIHALLTRCGLPTALPLDIDRQRLLNAFSLDKKIKHGKWRFILLNDLGSAFICDNVTRKQVEKVVARV